MKVSKLIISILFIFILISCKPRYIQVPVKEVKIEYVENIKYDSIYHKDSIYILQKGDTVIKNNVIYKYQYKYLKDTICIRDTIPIIQPIEVVKEVNKLKDYQVILMILGGASIILFIYKIVRT